MAHAARSTIALFLLFNTFGVAWAKPADNKGASEADPLGAARDAEGRLDYKGVIVHAQAALEQPQSHENLVALYQMLGTAYGVLGKSDQASDAFTKLLGIEPAFTLPRGLSPKVTRPFREAGGYWLDRPKGLQVLPGLPTEISVGKALALSVRLDDPLSMATNVRVSYRFQGDTEYKKLEAAVSPNISMTIPAEQIQPRAGGDYNVELFVTALSARGGELRQAGDPGHPLTVLVRGPKENLVVITNDKGQTVVVQKQKKPLIKQWWLWTAVGAVVVVGAALGGGLGYYYGRPDTTHVDVNLSSKVVP
jgi:hypothetical protein